MNMKRISFNKRFFYAIIAERKTQTRRLSSKELKVGEVVYSEYKHHKCFLSIRRIRYEKLQNISDEDCVSEGIIRRFVEDNEFIHFIDETNCYIHGWSKNSMNYSSPQDAFGALIDTIYGRGTWCNNPYVWVYDFELIKEM